MKHLILRLLYPFYRVFNLFFNSFHLGKATLKNSGKILFRCKIKCSGKGNKIFLHKGGIIRNSKITIYGNNNVIVIGKNTMINHGDLYIEDNGNTILIGNNCNLCGNVHLACTEGTKIEIGDDCLFSSEIVFRTGDSHSILDASSKRINLASDILIGNHVWICYRVLVNKGSHVASNSVIGSGAIVTKKFATPHVLIAGVPAKVIRENINWTPERISLGEEIS